MKKIRIIYDVTVRIGQNFTTKDRIAKEMRSGVVYEAACLQCNDKYIGKTCRHLKTRIDEHLSDLNNAIPSLPQPIVKTNPPVKKVSTKMITKTQNFHMTTRSATRMHEQTSKQRKNLPKPFDSSTTTSDNHTTTDRPQVPKKTHITRAKTRTLSKIPQSLPEEELDQILTETTSVQATKKARMPNSALTRHYLATGHLFTDQDFNILLADPHRYKLLIKESLLIKKTRPAFNGMERSLPLYIYPDGPVNRIPSTSPDRIPSAVEGNFAGTCH